jgi:hypothetical protein
MVNPVGHRPSDVTNYCPTNGEKRAAIYEGKGHPTDARAVTRRTPLARLNLNWREKELPEWQRTKHVHRLHPPYLGKYIPQLVEIFRRKFFERGETGSGPILWFGDNFGSSK